MWTDLVTAKTAQLSDGIKLELLTPAALAGLMEASYNEALILSRKFMLMIVRTTDGK